MILRCENCKTMYMFTEAQLKAQDYKFACKKCGHENTVALPAEAGGNEHAGAPILTETKPPEAAGTAAPQMPEQQEAPEGGLEAAQEALLKGMPNESLKEAEIPRETKAPPQQQEPAPEHEGSELGDIFSSLDTAKTDEKQPAPMDESMSAPVQQDAPAPSPGSGAAGAESPHKDEGIIEGFEEFTMDDLKGTEEGRSGTDEVQGGGEPAGQQETGWLESTKIDDTLGVPGQDDLSGETVPMEDTMPEMLKDNEATASSAHEAGVQQEHQATEHSLLTDETSVIPEVPQATESLFQETEEAVPVYHGHLMKVLIAAGAGLLVVILMLLGIYYYLVEYSPAHPDFNKLTLMTYSFFPVSDRAKDQARHMLKEADALYQEDTVYAYRKSLGLYEKAAATDHRLTGAFVGIVKDYAMLKDIDKTGVRIKDSARLVTRIGSLMHDDAEYDLLQGMVAIANDDLSVASDKIRMALEKSPKLPEALYYRAYIGFSQGATLTATASDLTQVIALDPAMTKAQLLLAEVYRQQQDAPHAIEILEGILGRDPYNTAAGIQEAELETNTTNTVQQSIAALNTMVAKGAHEIDDYDRARVYLEMGKLELFDNDYRAAIDAFKSSIQSRRTTAAYLALGNAYLHGGNLSDAETQYQTAVSSDSSSAEARFRLAHAYYLDHKYVLAIASYSDGLRIQGDNPRALYGLSRAREKNGELDIALDVIEKAVKLSPDSPAFIVLDGRLLREKGDYKKALAILSNAVGRFPDYAPLHTEYGVVLGDTGDYKDAIQQLTAALQISPAATDSYAYMADMLDRTGKYPEAEKYAKEALSGTNNFPYAYEVLGNVYLHEQKLSDAIRSYTTAISLMPYDAEVQYRLAQAYKAGKMFTEAVTYLDGAIKLSPNNALYHYCLGNVYRDMGNIQSAIDEYSKALDADSAMADAYYQRGLMNVAGRNDLAAVNDLKNAIKYAPNNPTYMLALANYYYTNKETFSAIAYLKQALKSAPKNAEIHSKLGTAYNYIGKTDEARREFTEALTLSHDFPDALIGMGSISYQQGNMQRAQQYYEKAVRLSPQDGDAHYALGTVYEYNGMYEKALAEYRDATRLSSNPASAYFKVGMMLANLNEPHRAKAALMKAINLGLPGDMESAAKNKLRNLM